MTAFASVAVAAAGLKEPPVTAAAVTVNVNVIAAACILANRIVGRKAPLLLLLSREMPRPVFC